MTAWPNAVVTDLKNKGVGPKKIPTTGQDATLQGMENILQGYQCGSVYKAVYQEAQDAVALATILRAGRDPALGPGQLDHHASPGRDGDGAAGVAAHPDVGERHQHGVDGHQGQVHLGVDAVHRGGSERLQRGRASRRNLRIGQMKCGTAAASCGGGPASGGMMAYICGRDGSDEMDRGERWTSPF